MEWIDEHPGKAIAALLFILIVVASIFAYLKLSTYHVTGRVIDLTWKRDINVERFKALGQDTYESQIPGDAYNIMRYTTESCTTNFIKVGKSEVPIESCHPNYMARYMVNRWTYDHTLEISGKPRDERIWPDFTPSPEQVLGADREANRVEIFYISFKVADGKTFVYSTNNYQDWRQYAIERDYSFDVNRFEEPQWATIAIVK